MDTTSSTQPRQPKGRPVGGQFATKENPEADTALDGAELGTTAHLEPLKEISRGEWEVTNTTTRMLSNDPIDGGMHLRRMEIVPGGRPDARSHAGAAAILMTDRFTQEDLLASLRERNGKHVTVLTQSPGSKSVTAREGTVIVQDDGKIGLMNKGSKVKGHYIAGVNGAPHVLGTRDGYGKQAELAEVYRSFEAQVPAVDPVSADQLDDIPLASYTDGGPRSDVAAVFLMDHPGFDDSTDGRGSMFFATDRDPEDVVNGYFVAPPGSGLYSESGSFTTTQLQQRSGRVRGYRPGALTFKRAMDLADDAEERHSMRAAYREVQRECT